MLTSYWDQAIALVRENIDWIEPIVFAMGFAESSIFLSFFVPSTVLFLAIGGIHSAAGGEFWSVWLAASAGAFLGDIVSYAIGRYFKNEIGGIWPLRQHPEWYLMATEYTRRYGALAIVLGKFTGLIRPFLPLVAGAMGMRWPLFLLASSFSCLAWAGVFLGPGYGIHFLVTGTSGN